MEYRDYYAALGVDKGASQADIKKAFRRLARESHPDVNKGDAAAEKRFKEISEANEVLSDPEKREAYDQLGANWGAYQQGGGAAPGNPFAGYAGGAGGAAGAGGFPGGMRFEYGGNTEDLAGFSDFFRTFFTSASGGAGGGGMGGGSATNLDPLFGGLGGDSGAGYAPSGFGTGSARGRRRAQPRPADAAADATISLEEVARGTERHIEVAGKTLEVKIPAGVRDGQKIRLSGKAEGGGNVYITVRVSRHPVFTRDGADLTMDLSLTLGEALLGADVHINTLSGKKLALTVPAGTQNGRVFRLTGQGLPRFGAEGNGDLRVRTKVVLPTFLDDEGKQKAQAFIDHIEQSDPRHDPAARPR
ncbi:MAG: DnaJ C-terminal domain-containing protein [Chloroflexota bacterium]|nr:DnaJ C-terminal domain-containing protein [Chloroflexota bacterium]